MATCDDGPEQRSAAVPTPVAPLLAEGEGSEEDDPIQTATCFLCEQTGHFARTCSLGPYYVHYFRLVAVTMLQHPHYGRLLDDTERQRAQAVLDLPRASLCLLVRLYNRRDAWLRADKLQYDDVRPPGIALTPSAADTAMAHRSPWIYSPCSMPFVRPATC